MAIPCPGCGREYDVTLFQFGRTIHCTCGRRVGLEHRVEVASGEGAPRFFADAMLGRLARWLRTLGYDTAFDAHISDGELTRRSVLEGRHVLTRDRRLLEEWRIGGGLLVGSERTMDQLREVVEAFRLPPPDRLFSRCRSCNAVLEPVGRSQVKGRVPLRVWTSSADFVECPDCGRIFWEGSHTARMRGVLARIFDPGARQEAASD